MCTILQYTPVDLREIIISSEKIISKFVTIKRFTYYIRLNRVYQSAYKIGLSIINDVVYYYKIFTQKNNARICSRVNLL